jgi:hypothetical protein
MLSALMTAMATAQGIGKYKIGSSLSKFPELNKARKIEKSEQYSTTLTWKDKSPIEVKADTSSPSAMINTTGVARNGTIRKNHRIFYLSEYKINTKIDAKVVWLFFRNDTLVYAWTKTILVFPLTAKYGEPETKMLSNNQVACNWTVDGCAISSHTYRSQENSAVTYEKDSDVTFTVIYDPARYELLVSEYKAENEATYARAAERLKKRERDLLLKDF